MVFTKARRERTWSVTLGVLLILLGILAMIVPVFASLMLIKLLGWLLIFAAIEQAVEAFQSRGEGGLFLKVSLAVVYGVVALMLLFRPVSGAIAATAIIATLFLLDGVMEILLALQMRREGRPTQWIIIGAVMSLVFAGIVLYWFPLSAAWTIGLLVGIRLVVKGIEHLTRWSPGTEPAAGRGRRAA
ncbi:MAG TPA: DUF308 domain-containing protein [Terriglobales bacterium]